MKVVIIGPAFPFRGGIADTNHNLAMTFKRRGYQTTLVTFTTQYPNFLFPGKNQFSEETPPNLEIHRKINSINPLTWFSSAKFINAINPDIVVVRYWIPYLAPALGFIARRLKAKRVMALCDNVIPHEKRKFDKFLSTYFLNSMDEFITLSEHVATELKSFNKTKVKSLFHPINEGLGSILDKAEARKKLGLNNSDSYILFFGLVREYKGLDLLLESLALAKNKELKLLIAGEFYESEEKYKLLISRLKLEDRVIIQNRFIPTEEIPYFFSAADVLGLTYKSASQSGITQMAFHFNLPILATKVGGLSEMIKHELVGYLSESNPADISKFIDKIFTNNDLEEFRENLSIEKEKYTWSSFLDRLLE